MLQAEFAEQSGVPDCVKCLRYVQRNGPKLMSDIQVEWHVQGGVTGPESELMI